MTDIIKGNCEATIQLKRLVEMVSKSNSTILLRGETGCGKDVVAREIHEESKRKGELINVNCAAIPSELLESELFGHEKGSFTGADERRIGRFEQANGGTLFLDEIGDMPLETQTRLLRVLSSGEFYRVGGREPIKVDVRIIAATHQKLEDKVLEGEFREDLFHRINVIRINLPKLSDRREDIPQLCKHFFRISSSELEEELKFLSEEVENYFMNLTWPGNVRQLENMCRLLTVMSPSREIRLEDLPDDLKNETVAVKEDWTTLLKNWADNSLSNGEEGLLNVALPEFEKTMIKAALNKTLGRKNEAAKLLGWGRNTLTRKIKELNLN